MITDNNPCILQKSWQSGAELACKAGFPMTLDKTSHQEKTQLLEAAKNRVESLLRELKTARADYANTKQAAYKAAAAAKQAKSNA